MFRTYITSYCGLLTSPYLLVAGRRMRYTLLSKGRVMLQREGEGNLSSTVSKRPGVSKLCAAQFTKSSQKWKTKSKKKKIYQLAGWKYDELITKRLRNKKFYHIYLAEFMKIAPAGYSSPHRLTGLKLSKYCKETQLIPMSLLRWLFSWFLI